MILPHKPSRSLSMKNLSGSLTVGVLIMLAGLPDRSSAQCLFDQTQKLIASDAAKGDEFGWSVSVSGNVAVVGAAIDDHAGGINAGSAYVYRFNGTTWVEEQKLTASDAAEWD